MPDARPPGARAARGRLWARVRALPPKQRAAILLRYAGDLSHREVAAALGSEEAARRRLPTARESAKEMTADRDRLAPPTLRPAADAAAAGRALRRERARRRRLRAGRLARRHAAWPPPPRAASPRSSYEDHRGGADAVLDGSRAALSPRILEAPAAWTTCAASSTSTSRAAGATSTCPSTGAQHPVRPARAEGDRRDPVRATQHLRRGGCAAGNAKARAPPATRSAPTRSRSSCPATA